MKHGEVFNGGFTSKRYHFTGSNRITSLPSLDPDRELKDLRFFNCLMDPDLDFCSNSTKSEFCQVNWCWEDTCPIRMRETSSTCTLTCNIFNCFTPEVPHWKLYQESLALQALLRRHAFFLPPRNLNKHRFCNVAYLPTQHWQQCTLTSSQDT